MVVNEINCLELLAQNPAQWQHSRNASKYYHDRRHFIQILTTNEVKRKKERKEKGPNLSQKTLFHLDVLSFGRNSLVVQYLEPSPSIAGSTGSISSQGTKNLRAAGLKK